MSAAIAAVGLEFAMRRGLNWLEFAWLYVPLALFVNYAIWRMLVSSQGWLQGIVMFTMCTGILRILLAFLVIREPLSKANIVSASVLLGTGVLNRIWRE